MSTCIDYYAFTFRDAELSAVLGYYGRYFSDFIVAKGHLGYRNCWRTDGCAIYYDGMPGMGVHVQVSGRGCARSSNSEAFTTWGCLMQEIVELGGVATRVDFAYDDTDGVLSVDKVLKCIEGGEVLCRYREHGIRKRCRGESMKEDCLYMGSSKSDNNLVVYDKRLETISRGEPDPGHWVRMELRLKSGIAASAVNWIVAHPNLEGVEGILAANIRFIVDNGQKNKSRCETAGWWQDFLHSAAKVKIAAVKDLKTVAERISQYMKQHAATFVMLKTLAQEMYDDVDFVKSFIATGVSNLRDRHKNTIAVYLSEWRRNQVALQT